MALIDAGRLAKALRTGACAMQKYNKYTAGYKQAIYDIARILESYETNEDVDAFVSATSAYRLTRWIGEWNETD